MYVRKVHCTKPRDGHFGHRLKPWIQGHKVLHTGWDRDLQSVPQCCPAAAVEQLESMTWVMVSKLGLK